MKIRKFEQFVDKASRLYPDLHKTTNGVKALSRTVTFQVTDACNLACTYCLSGDSLILMSDYSRKPIKDVIIGDKIIGFDEYSEDGNNVKVHSAEVLNTFTRQSQVYNVELINGQSLYITGNHKVLVYPDCQYKPIEELKSEDYVYYTPMNYFEKDGFIEDDIYQDYDRETIDKCFAASEEFKKGYVIGALISSSVQASTLSDEYLSVDNALDMVNLKIERYLNNLGLNDNSNLLSEGEDSTQEDVLLKLYEDNFNKSIMYEYNTGFICGLYEGQGALYDGSPMTINVFEQSIVNAIEKALTITDFPYTKIEESSNPDVYCQFVISINSLAPIKIQSITQLSEETDVYNIETSTGTYIANGMAVHNCYQINKGKRRMSLDTAKKFVDMLLDADESNTYINPTISPFIVLDFIGGEPLLEIDLIDQIMDYFVEQAFIREHPWATRYIISLCSNGTLYFNPNVVKFFNKHRQHLSFSVTIDGNKELHDSCRVFPDGSPSYDMAWAAAKDWMDKGGYIGSKITICPENLPYLNTALRHFIDLGYEEINANCVYEEGWKLEHATELYRQMKEFADYLLDNNLNNIYCSLYVDTFFKPKDINDLDNWCGGNGQMLACDPDGWLYPCIRYMESSLGDDQPPIRIGHVDHGIEKTEQEKCNVKCLNCIDRRTQSTDECFYCPIAEGCSWCSGFNYQEFGTPNARATYICVMHKARALANVYYWNKRYQKENVPEKMLCYVPEEWALPIIGKDEYDMLIELSGGQPGINQHENEFNKAKTT